MLLRGASILESLGFPLGQGTNNIGELTAALKGLEASVRLAEANEDVLLIADSLYLLQGLCNCDKFGQDPGRPNNGLWSGLYDVLCRLYSNGSRVWTQWVKGHASNAGNRLCDNLARNAAENQCRYVARRKK